MVVFKTLSAALKAGFQIYEKTSEGYTVRIMTSNGWATALVRPDVKTN